MAENNENKIRRRKVSSTNLKNTNNNRNTIKNSNNTKNKSKNSRNNKKESSVQDIKRKQEEKEQFELEREIYYRKKKIKRKKRLKLITRLASLCLILLVIGGICFSAFAISAIQGAPKVTKELIRENYISSELAYFFLDTVTKSIMAELNGAFASAFLRTAPERFHLISLKIILASMIHK